MTKILNYIGGNLVEPHSNEWIPNYEPATAEIYSQIPNSNSSDIESAVQAAEEAFDSWASSTAQERSKILLKIADLIDQKAELLALAESKDNGKPVSLARRVDIPRGAANFRFYATAILHDFNKSYQTKSNVFNYTIRIPLGVVGCISPWNLPLYLFSWKIAPALASGNCVIAKPSEVTPMSAYLLSEICIEAGLPPGVLNIVHGKGNQTGEAIIKHPQIKAISFTGGTATGAAISSIAAPMNKKLSLELGGKNPNIIFADCDYEKMLRTTLHSSFSNQGQICLCGSRIFIEKSIYSQFKKDFIESVNRLKVGDPNEQDVDIGAIVSENHRNKILYYIDLALQEGGTILAGGHAIQLNGRCKNGWFIAPTVIEGLDYNCKTNQEEIFGPVVTITPFETEEEVLKFANSTRYGLSATIWTENLNKAHRVAHKIESGIIWINCWLVRDLRTPFGGMKDSGIGREGGFDALHFFTEEKNICIEL